jgi:hypothetical protein
MNQSQKWEYRDLVCELRSDSLVPLGSKAIADLDDLRIITNFNPHKPERPSGPKPPFSEVPVAKEVFWRQHRELIEREIRRWREDGWELADRVDSSGIGIRIHQRFPGSAKLQAFFWVLTVLLVGVPLFWRGHFAELTEFRLAMRRSAGSA